MCKLLLLSILIVVAVEAYHEPCQGHADCIAHACPNHPEQHGVCEFEHHHDRFGACHCSDEHVHFCLDDSGCAGFPCEAGSVPRCTLHKHHHHGQQYCMCDF